MIASHRRLVSSLALFATAALTIPSLAQTDSNAAPPPATQPGIVDPSIGVPETSGESESEQLSTTSVDPSTGIVQISIGFKSPKARGLAQPGVSLSYSSEAGLGYAGWGWNLTIPSIERRPLSGPPNFDPAPATATTNWVPKDQLFYGGKRLVPICMVQQTECRNLGTQEIFPSVTAGWWYFRLAEDSSFDRFFLSPDQQTWLVQSKSGVFMELGKPLLGSTISPSLVPAATETTATPTAQNNVPFRWSLVRKYDAHSGATGPLNIVYYIWSGAPGTRLVLTDIYDTPNVSAAANGGLSFSEFAHHIAFQYQGWGSEWPGVQSPIWRAVPQKYLTGVDITSARFNDSPGQREMVRRYHFGYTTTRQRVFLSSVTLEGECTAPTFESPTTNLLPTTNCPTRPPTEFTYADAAIGSLQWLEQPLSGNVPSNAYLIDINSDGLPDFAQPAASSGKAGSVQISQYGQPGSVTLLAPQPLSVDVLASGATEQNFFPSPTATAFNFTAGSFTGTGSINAGWFSGASSSSSATYPFTAYAPAPGGGGWQWQKQAATNVALYPPNNWYFGGQNAYACAPGSVDTAAYAVGPETPYGSADVDGDGYPDLLTYAPYVSCFENCQPSPGSNNCPAPTVTGVYVGVGLYTTVKNQDGSLSPFALHHGTATPGSGFPTGPTFMQWIPLTDLTARLIPEDLNGDGLPDLLAVSTQGIAVAYGMGDGTLSYTGGLNNGGGTRPIVIDVPGLTITDPSKIYVHDINGDGLADILQVPSSGTDAVEFFLNENGEKFDTGQYLPAPLAGLTAANTRLSFGDMNGSGVDDVVVVQTGGSGDNAYYVDLRDGFRPGLITMVTNGLGAATTINYASTLQLDAAAQASGLPWVRHVPQVLHHVTSTVTTNSLPGVYAQTRETDYAYTNPVYDPRDQRFVGFQQVVKREVGAGNDPSGSVRTTFLTGLCPLDNPAATCPAAAADRPFLPLTGAPVLVETFDDSGNYLSTVHTTYEVKEVETGTDGTFVRFSLPTSVDSYLYDTSAPSTATSSTILADAQFPDSSTYAQLLRTITLRGTATHVQRSTSYDVYGNVLTSQDVGIVGGADQTITTASTWGRAPGDVTGWLWCKQTSVTAPFTSTGVFADQGRSTTYTYDAEGDLRIVQVALTGNVALNRFDALGRTPAPTPTDASKGGGALVEVTHHEYDPYGNPIQSIGPNGVSCEQVTYDPQFAQLPITDVVYTASPSTCSGAGITTSVAYNRGFEEPTLKTDPGGPFAMMAYDGFGRTSTITKSSPSNATQPSPEAAVQMNYADAPYEAVNTLTWDGTAYRATWAYTDGMGSAVLTLKQAASSDPGTWIASGIAQRGGRGHVVSAFAPYFISSIQPSALSLSAMQPTSASRQTVYDGFGRATRTYGYDGAQDGETHYHAISTDVYDALHLPEGNNALPATTQKDGHGRVVLSTVSGRIGQSTALTTVQTTYGYTSTGNLTTLSRSSGGTAVTQSTAHDSLGRMVENREPNSTTGANDWRYVYNDSGELVGTSDPRGCGVNMAYDAAGREVSEDYSPCEANHVAYTAPVIATGAGYETLYVFDAPVGTTPTSPNGRLYATISRGEFTQFAYDQRGRVETVTRALAMPGTPANDWHQRFAASSYSFNIAYDDADRVVTQGTGATALAIEGASTVTTSYDERGNIGGVTSSYGNLITSTQFDSDGQLLKYRYADHAQTLAQRDYDTLRRLWHSNVTRSPNWVSNGSIYTQPADGSTMETTLEAKTFTYDAVGNPGLITDASGPTIWPAGAQRMSRQILYDDFYHVTSVADNTGGDTYVQPYGPEFAGSTVSPVPATTSPSRIAWQTFNYDWLGNTTASDDDLHTFYDRSLGQITNDPVYPNRITAAAGTTPQDNLAVTYDAQGDVTAVGFSRSKPCTSPCTSQTLTYQWDELGRMSHAQREDEYGKLVHVVHFTGADYAYDSSGQRVLKTVTTDGTPLYSAEIFPTLRLNGATWNSSTSEYEDDVTTESAYLVGAGGPVARVEYSTTDPAVVNSGNLDNLHVLFELTDALGSTSFVIDRDTSEVVEASAYQPYGALESDFRTSRWGNFREQYKFTGKEDDIEVGVTYFGGRYYAPSLGRWMSPDPVAVHAQKGNLNVYAYASGRVFRVTDPTGLMDDNGAMLNGSSDPVMNTFGAAGAAAQFASTVPGFDTFAALQMQWASTDVTAGGTAALDGAANSVSDMVNGFAQWMGAQGSLLPTPAPGASSDNIFNALAYGAGGAVGGAVAFEGLSAAAEGANLGEAFAGLGKAASALGSGLGDFIADTRGGLNVAELLEADGAIDSASSAGFAADAHPTFSPGPYAGASIPARSSAQIFTTGERIAGNDIMEASGCHTCGTRNPATLSGNAVLDHQPVSALNFSNAPQRLYPQCLQCSSDQGIAVAQAQAALRRSQ